jgi:hypothetical protein
MVFQDISKSYSSTTGAKAYFSESLYTIKVSLFWDYHYASMPLICAD